MTASALPGDQAKVSVLVRVPPEDAFAIFTTEIDQWWRRGPRFRASGRHRGILHLEPKVGGRLFDLVEAMPRIGEVTKAPLLALRQRVLPEHLVEHDRE